MRPLALNEFTGYKFLSGLQYAPGGGAAAFVVSAARETENDYRSQLWLLEEGRTRFLADLGAGRSFFWQDAGHILFAAKRAEEEKKQAEAGETFTSLYRICIHGGEALPAYRLPVAVQGMKRIAGDVWAVTAGIDANAPDEYKMSGEERAALAKARKENADYEVLDELPFWANGGGFVNKKRTALFIWNEATGDIRRITAPLADLHSLCVAEGRAWFTAQEYDAKPEFQQELYCMDAEGNVTLLAQKNGLDIGAMFRVGGRLLAAATRHERFGLNENRCFYVFDEEKGAFELLAQNEYSLWNSVGSDCRYGGGTAQKAKGDSLYYITTREDSAHIRRLGADGADEPVLEKEGSADCFDICDERGEILLIGMYGMKLQEVYGFDPGSGEFRQLTHFNDEVLADKYVAECLPLCADSDGVRVNGWVLLPYGYDPAKKYPAILDIHGGPKTVYGPVFYHEMQYWAGQGYFVFFCNPTGSDGRDNAFADIRGKYGTVDYKNIMDLTDEVLKAYPAIDPARVGVTGGSYGGFMTNWIIGHTDRFACAASQRSISNWVSFYGISDIGAYFGADQTGGGLYTEEGVEKMWRHSPLKYAANVTTPTLFIHSDSDYRCPMAEGLQMFTALRDRGVPARLCWFKGENHELSRSGKPLHRIRRLEEITAWMNTYTKENA